MELSEIKLKLDTLKIPVAYMHFNKPQELPFAVFYESGTDIRGADHYNLIRDVTITIELYTEKKQPALEHQLENLFRDTEIRKAADTYIKDEDMYLISFEFGTIQHIQEEE